MQVFLQKKEVLPTESVADQPNPGYHVKDRVDGFAVEFWYVKTSVIESECNMRMKFVSREVAGVQVQVPIMENPTHIKKETYLVVYRPDLQTDTAQAKGIRQGQTQRHAPWRPRVQARSGALSLPPLQRHGQRRGLIP